MKFSNAKGIPARLNRRLRNVEGDRHDAMDRRDRAPGPDPRGTWHSVVISHFKRIHELEVLAGRLLTMVRGVCVRNRMAYLALVSATSVTTSKAADGDRRNRTTAE